MDLHNRHASSTERQRFQELFFPDGIAFDGNRSVRTDAATAASSYLQGIETGNEDLVGQNSASWNQIAGWLQQLDLIRTAA